MATHARVGLNHHRGTRLHRFFVPPGAVSEGRVILPDGPADQVSRVLRMRPGDEIAVFDGSGAEWSVTLDEMTGQRVSGDVGDERRPATEPLTRVTICQAMIKPELFELVLQKCTELGASRFIPLATSRVQRADSVTPSASRTTRWNRIVQEAAEQSGRVHLPAIAQPALLGGAVGSLVGQGPVVVLWEVQGRRSLKSVLTSVASSGPPSSLALVIGPAGGLERAEVELAEGAGALIAGLGERTLRAETAAIAALAATLYEFGAMG